MILIAVIIENCTTCQSFLSFAAFFCKQVGWTLFYITSDDLAKEDCPLRDYVSEFHLDEEGVFAAPVFVLEDESGAFIESLKPEDTGIFYRTFYPLSNGVVSNER